MNQDSVLKFKISSKKLSSGRCQVKFHVKGEAKKEVYGYALVDSKFTLKEVLDHLTYKIKTRSFNPYYLNRLLGKEHCMDSPIKNFLIFNR